MKLFKHRKLNSLGAAHLIIPFIAVFVIGGIGSYLLGVDHAQTPPGGGGSYALNSYSGNDDGCGGNATHFTSGVHVGRTNYGNPALSTCKCSNGKTLGYVSIPEPNIRPNPSCITASSASCPGDAGTSAQQAQMKSAGLKTNDYACAMYIFEHESHYCPTRVEGNLSTTCPSSAPSSIPECSVANSDCGYGMCQSTPADKMAVEGTGWQTSTVMQMAWCSAHAYDAYGNWQNSYAHWVSHHNW